MIEIEIDGKTLEAQPGETIIQVADKAGIYIPRFCYHKKMSVAASCRMCLVEVEKAPKTLPACATPVMPGMRINTRSEKALFSQKTVMEFLLINHPLDCPVCDQGGECELQDLSLGYGSGISRFSEGKRAIHSENLGPLIATEMTRCIQCTRCVRFGDEVAGLRELGAMGRGEELEIATYIERAVVSELSGNMIDVCPVGALTSKPYRFSARAWELRQHPAIAPHDCLGSNLFLHSRGEEYTSARHVMRVIPRENEAINEVWLSDRDRFSYEAINSPERLLSPQIKQGGQWQAVSWSVALQEVMTRLQALIQQSGAQQIGALVSANATLEESYLLQKLMRGLGSHNIDHRLRQSDFRHQQQAPLYPSLGLPIAELDNLDTLLLIGSNIRHEQPIASQRVRKAVKRGASVLCINPVDYHLNFAVAEKRTVGAGEFVPTLAKLLKALALSSLELRLGNDISVYLSDVTPGEVELAMAHKLLAGKNVAVILGAYALQHLDAAMVDVLATHIARFSNATFGILSEGANSAGAWLAGAVPHRNAVATVPVPGLNAYEMLNQSLRAYLLVGVEPELDSAYPAAALAALKQAELVVGLSAFHSEALSSYADILLPIATFAETSGTYVNAEGNWQPTSAAITPPAQVRPAWQVLVQLGQLFTLPQFNFPTSEAVLDELQVIVAQKPLAQDQAVDRVYAVNAQPGVLYRIGQWPMYRADSLVRRAPALQIAQGEHMASVQVNQALAKRLNLTVGMPVTVRQDQTRLTLPLVVDERIADNQVGISSGLALTSGFGAAFGEITIENLS